MHGEWIFKILETLGNIVVGTLDFGEAMIRAGYGASQGQILRNIDKIEQKRFKETAIQKRRQRFQQYIYKLKKQGLVKEIEKNNKNFLFLTKKGKNKLQLLKQKNTIFLPKKNYKKINGKRVIIVSFDIPENERSKRDWLRRSLIYFGFNLIHKSTWVGNVKLPEEFLADLNRLDMLGFIEIFEITKSGSLSKKFLERKIKC